MEKPEKKTPRKTALVKVAEKKTPAVKAAAARELAWTGKTGPAGALLELCEKVAFDRKAEDILRLDMSTVESALSDYYLLCTGLSEPHIGAIAERIRREVRTKLGIRPLLCNGEPRSHWIILDYGSVILHIMTPDAREKYQLEELWGDALRTDVVERLDRESAKLKKAISGAPEESF